MAGETGTEVQEQTAIDEAAADADFNAGFAPEAAQPPTATPGPEVPGAGADPAAPAPAEAAAPAEPPKYRQITETEWESMNARATEIEQIKAGQQSRDDKVFGHIGALKQTLEKLQTANGTGQPVEITAEDFAELAEEFPEFAVLQAKGLTKVLGRLRSGGAAVSKEDIETQIATRTADIRTQSIDAQLDAVVDGDWHAVVRDKPFTEWLSAQPDDIKALAASDSLRDASRALRMFKAAPKPKAPAPAPVPAPAAPSGRQRLLSAAAPPRGTAAHASAPTEDDEFNAAYKKGR